ncbi:MAG: SpoIID/LytB domain-containing protein [Oscillospiraceae bacterium]|nr:SpoIID/LytB domain-containing protein [Oscillospiraceae bacterium]
MKKLRLVPLVLILSLLIGAFPVSGGAAIANAALNVPNNIKVGLYYGSGELVYGNLLNSSENSDGRGYKFGYFDSARNFYSVAETDTTAITMVKDRNLYITRDSTNRYVDSPTSDFMGTVGCYHIRLPNGYTDYNAAKEAQAAYTGSFLLFENWVYYVMVGNYFSASEAAADAAARGISGSGYSASDRCVTVVETGTSNILFEFDCGTSFSLGVMPKPEFEGQKPLTWFKGYKYYGGFQYTRLTGNNLTVLNIVPIEDYIQGVLPYEMSVSWPIEALKAQAVCARTYAGQNIHKHGAYGFDVCATTDCQVYRGQNVTGDSIVQAATETAGQYVTYGSAIAPVYYHSADGGATENSENVFANPLPHLKGVLDPYEGTVKTGHDSWTYTYTPQQIKERLNAKGYAAGDILSVTPVYTAVGNIFSLTFKDSNGKTFIFKQRAAATILSFASGGKEIFSQRFTLSGNTTQSGALPAPPVAQINVTGSDEILEDVDGLYAIGGSGTAEALSGSSISIISSSGKQTVKLGKDYGAIRESGIAQTGSLFTISGSGWGHNVGMSQYGARAMALLGYSYEDIIRFYFTGVQLATNA